MKIGIIGAGQIGSALTRRFTAVGHEVFVANSRGPETLAQLVAETGAHAVTAQEVARSGDIVVLAIPGPRSVCTNLVEGGDEPYEKNSRWILIINEAVEIEL